MSKKDARKLSLEALAEKRRIAFRMKEKGYGRGEMAELLEVNPSTVSHWFKKARGTDKEEVISGKKRGVKKGTGKRLSPEQEEDIQYLITKNMPDDLGIQSALWTRKAVLALVEEYCGVTLPVRTMGHYLQSWGFTPQKPAKQAYEQQPEKVREWLDETYPALHRRAQEEGAEIHWGDETGIRSRCQHGRSYAPKGETPVQKVIGKYFGVNLISSITNRGKVQLMVYEGRFDSKMMIRFMERLVADQTRKVFLVLDNLKVHHSNEVTGWAECHKEKIELHFLPSYSPELNPDEYLNCDLKAEIHSKPQALDKDGLKEKVVRAMNFLQAAPPRVASYFKHPKIAYAA